MRFRARGERSPNRPGDLYSSQGLTFSVLGNCAQASFARPQPPASPGWCEPGGEQGVSSVDITCEQGEHRSPRRMAPAGVDSSSAHEAELILVHQIAKITPADYPDLLAAVDAGTPQRSHPSARHAHTRTRVRRRSRAKLPADAARAGRHRELRRWPDESPAWGLAGCGWASSRGKTSACRQSPSSNPPPHHSRPRRTCDAGSQTGTLRWPERP
jgi:hypothetical protein